MGGAWHCTNHTRAAGPLNLRSKGGLWESRPGSSCVYRGVTAVQWYPVPQRRGMGGVISATHTFVGSTPPCDWGQARHLAAQPSGDAANPLCGLDLLDGA